MADIKVPSWFDAEAYLTNKLEQLQVTDPDGKENGDTAWDADSLAKAMEDSGYTGEEGAYQHFLDWGMAENISPNEAFDVDAYLAAKAAQLNETNFEGKHWTAASVMDAIIANGMSSAWEHYQLYGSQEGIATSANFDSEAYFVAKVAQMNATEEQGRNNWSVDEVKAIFAEQGLTALEHYYLYGQDEKVAAYGQEVGVDFQHPDIDMSLADDFDSYNKAQEYPLIDALAAQADGSLAVNYTLKDADTDSVDAGDITVAQQAALKDFIAGATNGKDYADATITYRLDDTVANIDNVAGAILQGSNGYDITDSVANIAAGTKVTLENADAVTATVSGDVSVGYSAAAIENLGHIDQYDTAGLASDKVANITIDASAQAKAVTIDLSVLKSSEKVTLSATGGDGNDYLKGDATGNTLVGGKGADWLVGGEGNDIIFAGAKTSQNADKVYAEGADTIADNAINTDFVKIFFGPETDSNWIAADVQKSFFQGHNIVEGREGDDILVASSGKDLFLFQTGGGGSTGKTEELSFAELGKDTIHNFEVGQDVLFIMDQSENGDGDSPVGINHKFSAGWDTSKFENIDLQWNNNDYTAATITVKSAVTVDNEGTDLVIELVGIQGANSETSIEDFFGAALSA